MLVEPVAAVVWRLLAAGRNFASFAVSGHVGAPYTSLASINRHCTSGTGVQGFFLARMAGVTANSQGGQGVAPPRTPRLDGEHAVHPRLRYFAVKALYRVDHGVWDSLVSVVRLHNETVNIWTHLAGALGFAYMGAVILDGSFQRSQPSSALR